MPASPELHPGRLQAGLVAAAAAVAACVLAACAGGSGTETLAPVISAQPLPQAARAGSSVTFTVTASGSGLTFRWQLSIDAGATWADISGAGAAQYTIAAPTLSMNGYQYRAVVSGGGSSVTTVPVTLTVSPPLYAAGEVFRDCTDACPEMVAIPTGSVQMGMRAATDQGRDTASPVHTVTIAYALAVARGEVTKGEFARFVQATGYQTDAEKGPGCLISNATSGVVVAGSSWRAPGFTQTDAEPVVCVSWNDAQAYIAWLNGVSPVKGYRLLTEAEWEYVARAGQGSARYPWGDDIDYRLLCPWANSGDLTASATVPRLAGTQWTQCADGRAYTAPADALAANAFGLRNVIGNAWEWVQDGWHATYAGAPADGSEWAVSNGDTSRLFRGGGWNNHPTYLDPSYRARNAPTFAEEALGFRVARTQR